VLEDDEELVVWVGEEVGASLLAAHRDRDARPVGLVLLVEPGELDLDAIAGVAVAFLVVDDDRDVHTAQLGRARCR
jgi:hypothetical protein